MSELSDFLQTVSHLPFDQQRSMAIDEGLITDPDSQIPGVVSPPIVSDPGIIMPVGLFNVKIPFPQTISDPVIPDLPILDSIQTVDEDPQFPFIVEQGDSGFQEVVDINPLWVGAGEDPLTAADLSAQLEDFKTHFQQVHIISPSGESSFVEGSIAENRALLTNLGFKLADIEAGISQQESGSLVTQTYTGSQAQEDFFNTLGGLAGIIPLILVFMVLSKL